MLDNGLGDEYISASEIEKFAYCPLSWYLAIKNKQLNKYEEIDKCVEKHDKYLQEVKNIIKIEKKTTTSEYLVAGFSISATILAIIGIILYITYYVMEFTFITMLNSALWIIAGVFFLIVSLNTTEIVRKKRRYLHFPEGDIVYVGDKTANDIISENYKLIGKPDYIIKNIDYYIPIELKTGRTPRGPLFSHIIQVCAYCLLVEDNYKQKSYGLLYYPETNYKINFTDELKNTVLKIMEDIHNCKKTKIAHRNHAKVTKCKNCARRNICPEKLC